MSSIENMLVAGTVIPLAGFVILALFGSRLGKPASGWVATLAMAVSCGLATNVLIEWQGLGPFIDGMGPVERHLADSAPVVWTHIGSVPITIGIKLDSLTVVMFFMVAFVSTCIFVFSLGYMAGSSDQIDGRSMYHRFFAYLSLFGFSMLGLVVVDSLLFMFIFWELVGLCSYLLIGFYFHKKSATNAGLKAFITNRVGDFGFLIGLAMVFLYLGSFSLDDTAAAFEVAAHKAGVLDGELSLRTGEFIGEQVFLDSRWKESFDQRVNSAAGLFTPGWLGWSLATWMGVLLFCGAIGKSAQFPLHVWLPDAMEGPTPVSALIHAATMVAAGVYLVARIFVLLTPQAQMFIAVIGCITLTLAALVAIVQTDIKKVLAYSTISQLGYMILGMGIGAWIGALFHLLTHAFFKALLFLGSGQVIDGCHHEQDIRKLGGLHKKMPVTCWTFLVGVLAIAGAGIPLMHIGLGGYFSKDEILAVAYHRAYESKAGLSGWLLWIPIAIAYVTPFYMMRCWWLTFMGEPRDPHVYEQAHESKLMYMPLIVLSAGTLFASYFMFRPLVAECSPPTCLIEAFDGDALHHAHKALAPIVGGAFIVGFVAAWLIYRNGLVAGQAIAQRFKVVHTILIKKFYFDELYGFLLVGGMLVLKGLCLLFDKLVVDGLVNLSASLTERLSFFSGHVLDLKGVDGAVNAIGNSTWQLGGIVRAPQVGRVRNYILFAVCGAAAAIVLMIWP